jgi:acyl-CoA synthetase (AMP-forming)/AMP-acid ligase II
MTPPAAERVNVAGYLPAAAAHSPEQDAIIAPAGAGAWRRVTFAELDARASAIAHGLVAAGFERGEHTLVMVRAGVELITLTYALFKAGIVPVLIDPGMGRKAFLQCVARTRPTAFIGIPLAHALRLLFRSSFSSVARHVTVGRRWFWPGPTLEGLVREHRGKGPFPLAETSEDETAAILFTSGSTGPAKGAVYSHGNFEAQVRILKQTYGFGPGEVDLAAFPLFSLFDCAFGMTSVIPELDPSRPGTCDPAKVVAAIEEHATTTAFGSPAIWRRVAPWCLARGKRLTGLRRVLIAGASVPPALIEQLHQVLGPDGDVETPYGATEALPVASIRGREIVGETAAASQGGAGTCVGQPVTGVEVRIVGIADGPILSWSDATECAEGEVGEICAKGPVVTRSYDKLLEATVGSKIRDGEELWHRMGDLGYRDPQGRIWFCGRKTERVRTASGTLFTDRVEGIFNAHPKVARCALVGAGESEQERPVLIVEGKRDEALAEELRSLAPVDAILFHPRFPVDVRHNAKIHRRTLKAWAERQLGVAPTDAK